MWAYTVSKKNIPPLTCYNLDIHYPITIIFGRSVTEKAGNQTMLCFFTSPIYRFSITLQNMKPRRLVLCACNTVQLLMRCRLWTMPLQQPRAERKVKCLLIAYFISHICAKNLKILSRVSNL